jgi:hypothetical protein
MSGSPPQSPSPSSSGLPDDLLKRLIKLTIDEAAQNNKNSIPLVSVVNPAHPTQQIAVSVAASHFVASAANYIIPNLDDAKNEETLRSTVNDWYKKISTHLKAQEIILTPQIFKDNISIFLEGILVDSENGRKPSFAGRLTSRRTFSNWLESKRSPKQANCSQTFSTTRPRRRSNTALPSPV